MAARATPPFLTQPPWRGPPPPRRNSRHHRRPSFPAAPHATMVQIERNHNDSQLSPPQPSPQPPPVTDPFDVNRYLPPPPDSPFRQRRSIAVLGARGVGKSAFTIQCVSGVFEPEYMPTCEDTFLWTTTVDGTSYDLTIVDADGQDEFPDFGQQYTIGVDAYVLMFSVLHEHTFKVIKRVHDKLLDTLLVLNRNGTAELPRILVGNQVDDTQRRRVPQKVAQDYADHNGIPYYETSALTGENVKDVFVRLLRIIYANQADSEQASATLSQSKSQPRLSQKEHKADFCSVQ
ncbi:unnamed protein product [Agarophyton chilense]